MKPNIKKPIATLLLFYLHGAALACPVCERQQPKLLRGVVHGAGPQNNWDYLITWTAVVVVLFTLFFSVKWLVRPGEKSSTHIKRLILNND